MRVSFKMLVQVLQRLWRETGSSLTLFTRFRADKVGQGLDAVAISFLCFAHPFLEHGFYFLRRLGRDVELFESGMEKWKPYPYKKQYILVIIDDVARLNKWLLQRLLPKFQGLVYYNQLWLTAHRSRSICRVKIGRTKICHVTRLIGGKWQISSRHIMISVYVKSVCIDLPTNSRLTISGAFCGTQRLTDLRLRQA